MRKSARYEAVQQYKFSSFAEALFSHLQTHTDKE